MTGPRATTVNIGLTVMVLSVKRKSGTTNEANKRLVLHVQIRCGLLSIIITVSLLANEFHVRSVLHGQANLAAVNHIYVFHEAMKGCKNLKIH